MRKIYDPEMTKKKSQVSPTFPSTTAPENEVKITEFLEASFQLDLSIFSSSLFYNQEPRFYKIKSPLTVL